MQLPKKDISRSGFTLLELLIVVTIIAILAVLIIVQLDPLTQFAESRNVRRWSHTQSISTALYRYIIANDSLPPGVDSSERQIGTADSGCSSNCPEAADDCLDLSDALSDYLSEIPSDPLADDITTGYSVQVIDGNAIQVKACLAENGSEIQLSR